jgi:hypothetical protein
MEDSVEALVNMTTVQIYFMNVVKEQTYAIALQEEVVVAFQALDMLDVYWLYDRYRDSLPSISNPPLEGMEQEIALLARMSLNKNEYDTEDE